MQAFQTIIDHLEMKYEKPTIYFLGAIGTLLAACGQGFLDIKPNQQTLVPQTVADFRALVEDLNVFAFSSPHALGIIGSDEFYITDAQYQSFPTGVTYNYQKNAYTWNETVYEGDEKATDWSNGYERVLQANVVLDGLRRIEPNQYEKAAWSFTRGSALFHRANAYYGLAQLYCVPYDSASSTMDLGLPLRIEADPSLKVQRSSVQETYGLIISDLIAAEPLLPASPSLPATPSKQAVFALLTRLYMQMGNYSEARSYAEKCLQLNDTLLDYNELDVSASNPFPPDGIGNPEVIFLNTAPVLGIYSSSRLNVDTTLLNSYEPYDLRAAVFFRENNSRITIKGTYKGSSTFMFTGYALDEVYLNLAECTARLGDGQGALRLLNHLLAHRVQEDHYTPLDLESQAEILEYILWERKKELVFRGIRWEDLRRLNGGGQRGEEISRTVKGQEITLRPDDPRWTWPLPLEAVNNGNYQQNPR